MQKAKNAYHMVYIFMFVVNLRCWINFSVLIYALVYFLHLQSVDNFESALDTQHIGFSSLWWYQITVSRNTIQINIYILDFVLIKHT